MSKDIHVSRIPKDTGPAGWLSILSKQKDYPKLEQDIKADWVIVGGGFTGLAAAQRLKQLVGSDETIVVLEAGKLALGPSGRNSGFMIDLPHELNSSTYAGGLESDRKQIKLNRCAIEFAQSIANEYSMPDKVFHRSGKITAAATPHGEKHISSYSKHLDQLNEDYRLMSSSELSDLTGTQFYSKGIFTPHAAMVQPAAYITQLAQGLTPRVSIYENTPVLKIEKGDVHKLHTPNGCVSSRNVILAVNGHIQSFGFYPKRLLHVFTYASMTRQLTSKELSTLGGADDWGILPADPMGTTVRKISNLDQSGHRITVRNRFTLNQSMEISDKHIKQVIKDHDQAYLTRFPMLGNVPMEHRWGGRLCLSWNSVPAFGEVENRIFSAACQNGLGTVKGTLSGMLAVDLALKQSSNFLDEYQNYDYPSRLPPEPFLTLGATANLRFKEWQAGIEM